MGGVVGQWREPVGRPHLSTHRKVTNGQVYVRLCKKYTFDRMTTHDKNIDMGHPVKIYLIFTMILFGSEYSTRDYVHFLIRTDLGKT